MSGLRSVAVFVGTRADLGPLSPVIAELAAAPDLDLHLLTGVMYSPDDLVRGLALPSNARFVTESTGTPGRSASKQCFEAGDGVGEEGVGEVVTVHGLAEPMREMTVAAQLEQGSVLTAAAGRVLADIGADVLVVLGDRWELLYVVPPAFLLGVPIVHLHGGEVTEGAVDERIRHAVTKLADEHCVASPDAARRVAQMGEPLERIHVTGAAGLDRLAGATPWTDAQLADLLGLESVIRPVVLFTYHPPTARADAPVGRWAREAAEAALAMGGTVVASYPGMDEGRDEIISVLTELAASEPRFCFVEALGRNYPRVLASVDVVVGNSSSGVIEAATLHQPAVDVGDRQRGRLRGDNVVHADEGRDAVERAIRSALSPEHRARSAATANPYGVGDASARILDIVRTAGSAGRVKPFADLPASDDPPVEQEVTT